MTLAPISIYPWLFVWEFGLLYFSERCLVGNGRVCVVDDLTLHNSECCNGKYTSTVLQKKPHFAYKQISVLILYIFLIFSVQTLFPCFLQ